MKYFLNFNNFIKEALEYDNLNELLIKDDEEIKNMIEYELDNNIIDYPSVDYDDKFNDDELFIFIKNRIHIFSKLPQKVKLYRIINLEGNSLDEHNIGKHYCLDWKLFDFNYFEKINLNYYDLEKLYVIEVEIPKSWIDFLTTIKQNILFPSEEEISVRIRIDKKQLISIKPYLEYFPDTNL